MERTSEQMAMEQQPMYYRETGGDMVVTREEERLNYTERRIKDSDVDLGCPSVERIKEIQVNK